MKAELLKYLIPFLIGAAIAWGLTSKFSEREKELRVEQVHDLQDLKRIQGLQKKLVERDTLWSRTYRKAVDSVKSLRAKELPMLVKYIRVKEEPLKVTTDKELDSLIDEIIR